MDEVEVTQEILTVPEFTEALYEGLTTIVNGTTELLALVSEPGIQPGKIKVTVITIPSKVISASYLFTDGSRKPSWDTCGISNEVNGQLQNMATVFSTLTRALLRFDFPLESIPSGSFLKLVPSEIESINIRSILTLSAYGNTTIQEDYLLMYLLFSKNNKYFNEEFKNFIRTYKYSLIPNKGELVAQLSSRFQNILVAIKTSKFNSNAPTRESIYNEGYIMFTMFLIIQRYVFNDVFIMNLDKTQEMLIDIIKTSASPWQYIKDAIEVLVKQKELDGLSNTYLEYKISFRNHMLKYVVSYLESSKTKLLEEIKL